MRIPNATRGLWLALTLATIAMPTLASQGAADASPAANLTLRLVEPDWSQLKPSDAAPLRKAWKEALDLVSADGAGRWKLQTQESSRPAPQGGDGYIKATLNGNPGAWMAFFQLEGNPRLPGLMKYLSFPGPQPSLYLEFARAIEALARQLEPARAAGRASLIDSFSPQDLMGVDFPAGALAALYPSGLALRRDGRLALACGAMVLELDERWQVTGMPTRKLNEEGNNFYAYALAMTPAGTLLVRNADGSGVWSFPEGQSSYRRLRIESPAGSVFGVMEDGSPFVVSASPRMAAIYRDGAVTSLPLPADSAVFAAAAGSEDSLWLADAAKGSLTAWTADGRIRDIVYPELQAGQTLMRLKTLPDGGFLAATNQAVARFDRFGRLIWNWDGAAEGIPLNLSTYTDLAVGSGGIVYLSDYLGKRVLRLAEPGSRLPEGLAAVAAAGAAFRAAPSRAELLLPLARAYEKMGAVEAARATLARYLEERPADAAEADRLQGLEASLLKLRAASAKADALALLGRYGPETGREAYARAMRTYESLRVRLPDDRELAQSLAELRSAFQKADSASVSALPTPQVAGVELAALFPSLLNAYRSKPAGYITIRNGGNEAFRELRAELFIAKYMDFPSIGPVVARLEAGKELRLELSAFLNEAALEVQEDLPLQARISLHFTDSKGTRSLELTRPVVLYRRTALTWDETGKLAAFVTPNEETIARAAFALMGGATERPLVSTSFGRALAISDALGSLPLRYVPDPQSPVTAILGNSTVVDTVRFPRTTLSYQGGDCDDTTALLCSLLEASGIATAILTTPGHVFLAFDSGEREEAAWLFQAAGYRVIAREGRVWIPLESTLLAKGFAAAWKEASELVRKEEGGKDFEFLPLASLRQAYPSLPLPPSSLPLILPDAEARAALDRAVAASLGQELMGPVAAAIEATRTQATGKEWSRQSNRLAQLYARWNQGERAATLWKEILRRDPAYVAAYLNLANLGLQAGKREEALAWLGKAEAAAPGSTSVADWATRTGLSSALAAGGGGTAAARAPLAQSASGGASDPAGGAGRAAGATAIVWEGD